MTPSMFMLLSENGTNVIPRPAPTRLRVDVMRRANCVDAPRFGLGQRVGTWKCHDHWLVKQRRDSQSVSIARRSENDGNVHLLVPYAIDGLIAKTFLQGQRGQAPRNARMARGTTG